VIAIQETTSREGLRGEQYIPRLISDTSIANKALLGVIVIIKDIDNYNLINYSISKNHTPT